MGERIDHGPSTRSVVSVYGGGVPIGETGVDVRSAGTPDTVVVASFPQRAEAEFAVQALAAHGVDAWVAADDYGGLAGFQLAGGAEVRVRPEHAALAHEVLDEDPVEPSPHTSVLQGVPPWPVVAIVVLFVGLAVAVFLLG